MQIVRAGRLQAVPWCQSVLWGLVAVRGCGVVWALGPSHLLPSPGHFGVVYHGEYVDEAQNRVHCAIKSLSRKWDGGWAVLVPAVSPPPPSLRDPERETLPLLSPSA